MSKSKHSSPSSKDGLGDRMKGYEHATRTVLPGRLPVIIRVDGKAFHTYTRGCKRPWDDRLTEVMDLTAIELCKAIQGAQMAYVQSDEISVLLHSYKKIESTSWFDSQVQKMVSVAAGIASSSFTANSWKIWEDPRPKSLSELPALVANIRPAVFDARAFIIPEQDVVNYFLWRQQDASRNSVQMLARSLYSHKDLDGKKTAALQELCFQKGRNWNDEPTRFRRGRCIVKKQHTVPASHGSDSALRSRWEVDNEIPVFSQDRDYIAQHLLVPAHQDDSL